MGKLYSGGRSAWQNRPPQPVRLHEFEQVRAALDHSARMALVIDQGTLPPIDLAPGASKDVTLPIKLTSSAKPGREYFVQLSFALAKPEIWARSWL